MAIRVGTACIIALGVLWLAAQYGKFADVGILLLCSLPLAIGVAALYFRHGDKTVTVRPPQNLFNGAQEDTQRELDKASRSTLYWQQRYQEQRKDAP